MDTKFVYVYLLDTLADWEIGLITAELNSGRFFKKNSPKFIIKTVALTTEPVLTMGGLKIIPDITIEEIDILSAAILILPGSTLWLKQDNSIIMEKTLQFIKNNIPIAAICGATMELANTGLLDKFRHTSNNLQFLKSVCTKYKGEDLYCEENAVIDNNLITASGIAPLEFAYQILKKLDVFSEETLNNWYNLFKTQKEEYFFNLLHSLQKADG
ncbi:MAG: type 1 glutamine amidotransferase family protein [bacterium]